MTTKTFSFDHVPPVFKRHHHALVALFDADNRLYLSRKHIYPTDIYRLFGGGVETGETKEAAAGREMREETGLNIQPAFQEAFDFTILETSTNETYHIIFELFYTNIGRQRITPGDDVKGMRVVTQEDMPELIALYFDLSKAAFVDKHDQTFTWHDWGIVFGVIHQYVFDHWPR